MKFLKSFVTLYKVNLLTAGNKNIVTDKNLQKKGIRRVDSSPNNLNENSQKALLCENLKKLKKLNFSSKFDFFKEFKIKDFYLLKYKNAHFLLLSGETIIYSGWSSNIQQILEDSINKVYNQVDKITLTDHTYSEKGNSRRLRSLRGGLRRLLLIVQSGKNILTNKQIIKDLEYFIILGNEDKLVTQIFAVENNTKPHNLTSSSFADTLGPYGANDLALHANGNEPEAYRGLKKRDVTEDPYCYLNYMQSIPVQEMAKPCLEFEEIFLSRRLEKVSRRLKEINLQKS